MARWRRLGGLFLRGDVSRRDVAPCSTATRRPLERSPEGSLAEATCRPLSPLGLTPGADASIADPRAAAVLADLSGGKAFRLRRSALPGAAPACRPLPARRCPKRVSESSPNSSRRRVGLAVPIYVPSW